MTRQYTRRASQMVEGAEEPSEPTEAVAPSRRRRRASTGGLTLKLDAPQRAGFVRRWVIDDPSRVLKMQDLGYDFVTDRAGEGAHRTDGMGTRITRHGGKDQTGAPHQMVLMECTEEDYAIGQADREEALKPFEQALRAGRDTTNRIEGAYSPEGGASSLGNSFNPTG